MASQEVIDRHVEALDFRKELQLLKDSVPKINLPTALGATSGLAAGAGVIQLSDWIAEASTTAATSGVL